MPQKSAVRKLAKSSGVNLASSRAIQTSKLVRKRLACAKSTPAPWRPRRDADRPRPEAPAPRRRRRGAERPKRLAPVEAPAPKRHRAIVEDELDPTTWRIPISWERYRSANCTRGPLPLPSGSATDVFGPMSPICDNCLDLVRAGEAAWCRCTHCPAFEEEVGEKAPTTPPLRAA